MAKAKKRVSKVSKIKKEWYPILAPAAFNDQVIGETLVGDANKSLGKTVSANLSNLTGNMRKQNIHITFLVNSIKDKKALTETIGYKVIPSSLKRMVRRGKNKVETNITAKTADNKDLLFKLIIITNKLTYLSVQTSLRKAAKENLQRILKKVKYSELIRMITTNKLQADLKKILSKTYPTRICEIREMKVLGSKKSAEEKEAEEKEDSEVETSDEKLEEKPQEEDKDRKTKEKPEAKGKEEKEDPEKEEKAEEPEKEPEDKKEEPAEEPEKKEKEE